jgi:hypothetical protein
VRRLKYSTSAQPRGVALDVVRALLVALILLPDGLTVQEFEKLHKDLQPPRNEPWLSIPWKTNLLEARAAAAEQKKPIFIWSMDGHPLGCG